MDFGRSSDPSAIVFVAYDDLSDTTYIFEEMYLNNDRSPEAVAKAIANSKYPGIPVIVPHDGNMSAKDGGTETRASILRNLGINVSRATFSNPPEVQNRILDVGKKHLGKEGGLSWMNWLFKSGKLKACDHLYHFFKEKRGYFYTMKNGIFVPKDGDDHIMDASRLAVLSVKRFGMSADYCTAEYINNDTPEELLTIGPWTIGGSNEH